MTSWFGQGVLDAHISCVIRLYRYAREDPSAILGFFTDASSPFWYSQKLEVKKATSFSPTQVHAAAAVAALALDLFWLHCEQNPNRSVVTLDPEPSSILKGP